MIIQWGKHISGQSATNQISIWIDFPLAFPYYPVAFSAVANDFSDICAVREDIPTGFQMNIHERYADQIAFANFWWICIGY